MKVSKVWIFATSFCTGNEVSANRLRPRFNNKQNVASTGFCESCVETIQMIEQFLKDQKIEEEIIDLLDQFCDTLPGDASQSCRQIAEKYVPLVVKLIETGIETLDICHKIGFCSYNSHQTKQNIQQSKYNVDANKILMYYKHIKQERLQNNQ